MLGSFYFLAKYFTLFFLAFFFAILLTFNQSGYAAERGRVVIQNGTVMSDRGALLRGATMELDAPGAWTSNFAIDPNHWKQVHDLKLNVVRFDVKLKDASGGAQTISNQLPYIDQAVNLAAQNDVYISLMSTVNQPGTYELQELKIFWALVADRYKDRTHVLYEMTNEPVAWYPHDYSSQNISDLKSVYDLMRSKAPKTHIVLWDFPNLDDSQSTINKISQMSGITYSNESVAFHYYDADPKAITTIKNTYPIFMTEVSTGPPPTDDIAHLEIMENLGISWISLEGKGDFNRLQNAVLSQMHLSGYDWSRDSDPGSSLPATITPVAVSTPLFIDTGGVENFVGEDGNLWVADQYFDGGSTVDRGPVTIAGASASKAFQTERYCMNGYHIPIKNATYKVVFGFAETYTGDVGAGKRLFDIDVENTTIPNVDVFSEAKGSYKALEKGVTVAVSDGELTIVFKKKVGCPEINALKVLPE